MRHVLQQPQCLPTASPLHIESNGSPLLATVAQLYALQLPMISSKSESLRACPKT